MIVVGDRVRFDPFQHDKGQDIGFYRKNVPGEVVEVNQEHRDELPARCDGAVRGVPWQAL